MGRLTGARCVDGRVPFGWFQRPWYLLAVLSLLMGFASISTDFYLPAMPAMAMSLKVDDGALAFTISGYLGGFSLGQLFWGPFSDRFGRRQPVRAGIVLFTIGSIGCALSYSILSVVVWRVVQALGASAGVVLARAMVRDRYAGVQAARMLSVLITVMAIAPLVGPLIGGHIAEWFGWRAIFLMLVLIGLTTLLALLPIPETLAVEKRRHESAIGAVRQYVELLKDRRLLKYAGAGGFFYAAMFAYISGTPFAFIVYYRIPASYYGFLFGAGIVGIMVTNILNTRLVACLGVGRTLRVGTMLAAIMGIAVMVSSMLEWGGVWVLFITLFLFVSTTGLIIANSISEAMEGFPHQAGAVSALVGALQYGSGIVGSSLVGLLANGTPIPMGVVIAAMSIGSYLCMRIAVSRE
ncbi:multidrug effflux MFS transporter [Zymobacter sp. IVIA_5232.4 C2]|uniref:multidrug effflux MFS transporter n=1 Tax=Zymobacter sp. IVIA_5232.4 C2 TaxID=3394855 RepID=UPI0039C12632